MIKDVIIIGAGAAGLFCGLNIRNKDILIIEKNSKPGKKLLISGKGQCNYTNFEDIKNFSQRYGKNYKFIRYSLSKFTNGDFIKFLKLRGFESYIREDKKVFPSTLSAEDFVNFLYNKCLDNNVKFKFSTRVIDVNYEAGIFKVKTKNEIHLTKTLIITTGGITYPSTGSTGDGYKFAKKLGHTIVQTREALTPILIKEFDFSNLAGITLEDRLVSIWRDDKKIKDFRGTILFTHKGISGPGILNNSRYMEIGDIIRIGLVHYENENSFREKFLESFNSSGKFMIKTFLKRFNIPKRLIENILLHLNISQNKLCSEIDKTERRKIIKYLIGYPFKIDNFGGNHIAMVTRGGVCLKEINSKTMESKLIRGLYFAGEILDIDGDTGGYNIQAAISTAKVIADNLNNLN